MLRNWHPYARLWAAFVTLAGTFYVSLSAVNAWGASLGTPLSRGAVFEAMARAAVIAVIVGVPLVLVGAFIGRTVQRNESSRGNTDHAA